MTLGAGDLDRRVQFRRATMSDDGLAQVETWEDLGSPVWAKVSFLSDGERWRAAQVQAQATARIVVRYSRFSADITAADMVTCDGDEYEISDIKPLAGRGTFIELTVTRVTVRE